MFHLYRPWVYWIGYPFDWILCIALISISIRRVGHKQFTSISDNESTRKPLPRDVWFWIAIRSTGNGCSSCVAGLGWIEFQILDGNWNIKTIESVEIENVIPKGVAGWKYFTIWPNQMCYNCFTTYLTLLLNFRNILWKKIYFPRNIKFSLSHSAIRCDFRIESENIAHTWSLLDQSEAVIFTWDVIQFISISYSLEKLFLYQVLIWTQRTSNRPE